MKNRWSKENPVSLSELLKITPVANEILNLSEEFGVSVNELLWTVYQIAENLQDSEDLSPDNFLDSLGDFDEDDEIESLEMIQAAMKENNKYLVSFDILGGEKLPQVSMKVGLNNKDDIKVLFDMISEMIEKI